MDKYGRKAEEYLEKLEREEPNEKTLELRAAMLINMAGDKFMEIMGGEMGRYDGGESDYYRGRRRDSRSRSRYDGGRSGSGMYDGGGRSGGSSGGSRYDGEDYEEMERMEREGGEEDYYRGGRRGRR